MTESKRRKNVLGRLIDVLRGADTVFGETAADAADVTTLRRELEEAEKRIAALQATCADLERAGEQAAESARAAAALELLESVAGPLSQLATLRHLAAGGTVPDAGDVLRLTEALQKAFASRGLEVLGAPGQTVSFDPALHRPAGREQLQKSDNATIRFVGFRIGERIVRPAVVSKEEK